ncbi:MAG: carbohydrate-binding domain-containing protein [Faecalibacterium prausnitzii]|nr:carbohydrate-binding domain-containing protein [Faecalibacterium prausnitzii]
MRKKSTRHLSAALAACMMRSVLPVGAFAAEPGTEPENGNGVSAQAEETLPFAGKEITEGGTYTMKGGPYTGPITVNVQDGQDVIINITGHVTTNIRDMLIKVVKGHVTINGGNDAIVENMSEPGFYYGLGPALIGLSSTDDNTTVKINGGTYRKKLGATVGCANDSKGTLTIISGTFETGKGGAVVNRAAESAAVMRIEGGTFIGRESYDNYHSTYALESYGTTIINDGNFQGYKDIVVSQRNGELQIDGGTFELRNPDGGDVMYITSGPSKTTITGGYFKSLQGSSWGHVVFYSPYTGSVEKNALFITGGTFEIVGGDVDGICVDYTGHATIENATIKVNASGKGAGIVRRVSSENEVALKVKNVTIENDGSLGDFSDILLDNYRPGPVDLEITEDFTHKAVVDATQIVDGLQVTTKTATNYQKDLKLVSTDPKYIIDYKNDDGTEYRYFNTRETGKYYVNPIHATMKAEDGTEMRPYSQFKEGDKVFLTAFSNEEGKKCTGWKVEKIAAEGVTEVQGVVDYDPENPETATLTMPTPGYDMFVTAEYEDEIGDLGTGDAAAGNIQGALSAVVVGAAAGAIIYEAGTGIYRVINMPGIPMPSNRIELAELLWERADKPEPVSTALYDDIDEDDPDAQKAARWAVEQDLMKDDADNNKFNPYFPVSKLRVCLTWNAAKEKGLFDTDKPAE